MINALKLSGLALAAAFTFSATSGFAEDEHFIKDGAVVGGYDVVAYHTAGAPAKGSADHAVTYQGATWHFSSAENKALFEAEPAKYAPAYGGWCSVGASKAKKIAVKPEFWAIVDGQLYLNSSAGAHENVFLPKTEETISKGETHWKQIFATAESEL